MVNEKKISVIISIHVVHTGNKSFKMMFMEKRKPM
jgi:hypothetical protein